ncbi:MAG: hypothetical protein NW223_10145 [Hyphomicrobiaceae bacterium]|nr:hypothetical protein [Hyphomicrobiaceae bacterium]
MEITDIKIPFWRLVVIFVKWAIAAIPATIILVLIGSLVAALIAGLLGMPFAPPRRGF